MGNAEYMGVLFELLFLHDLSSDRRKPGQILSFITAVLVRKDQTVIYLGLTVFVAIFEADRILGTSYYTPLLQIDERGQVLDLRTVAEYVHRELNGNATSGPNSNVRYRGQTGGP